MAALTRLPSDTRFRRRLARRRALDKLFHFIFLASSLIGIVTLAALLFDVFRKGLGWLDWDFLTSFPSRFPHRAGIKAALAGSVWVVGLTALIAFPVGVAAAIYLEEFAPRNRWTQIINTNISNLAGVPSVVYGILGLAIFVRGLGLGRSVLSGALTLALLVLPIIIIASQEAIRAVPDSIRRASYALGATQWQTVRHAVLPSALPGILTGTILAISRALGETAPLLIVGALTFVAFTPLGPMDVFTVLPIQIFNWTSRPQEEFRAIAAAAIIVLLAMLLTMNALAVYLRNKYQGKTEN